jgi:Sulfotransferase domain
MKKPNLFIVGAPRCGTTTLWSFLREQPEIFMSAEKELYFFDSDLWARDGWAPTVEQYLANFSSAADDQKVVGEATPSYLRSQRASAQIKSFSPEARIIIMLRNPLDVMYSLHAQGLRYGTEPIKDFEVALRTDRKRVGRESLGYWDFTDFPDQVKRYFNLFGRERVHIVIFDDLKHDSASACEATLRFLGVNPDFASTPAVRNANLEARIPGLQRILERRPRVYASASRLFPKELGIRISRFVSGWNLVERPRPSMNPELQKRLQKEFEPKLEELSKLLGRALCTWFQG